jgi:aspartyl protease family protein
MVGWAFKQSLIWLAAGVIAFLVMEQTSLPTGSSGSAREGDRGASPRHEDAGSRTLSIEADGRGHFMVNAEVDGAPVRFMVDTGASAVVLSPKDADRLGLHLRHDDYSEVANTPGGSVRIAPVTLREVRIDQLVLYDVEAFVNQHAMSESLLGMTFLRRLDGFEVADDELILSW